MALHKKGLNSLCVQPLFYLIGNFSEIPYQIKNSPRDRTAADMQMPLARPAAGGESYFAGFFLIF